MTCAGFYLSSNTSHRCPDAARLTSVDADHRRYANTGWDRKTMRVAERIKTRRCNAPTDRRIWWHVNRTIAGHAAFYRVSAFARAMDVAGLPDWSGKPLPIRDGPARTLLAN
jgi:hypothetical protein